MTRDAPKVVMPSSPTAKRKDVALVSQEKGGTSHAAKAKKKTNENKGSRSQYDQAVGLGSSGKKREIVGTRFISPKRLRPPEVRRVTERKRRDKFNEKLKELQELLPRCSKLDKASTLDKAIGYIKDLQKQVRMISGGYEYDMSMQMYPQLSQPCMPPVRMLTEMNVPALQALHTSMNPAGMVPLAPPPLPQYQHKPPPVNSAFQHSMASAAMFQFPQSEHPSTFPFFMQGNFKM